MLALCCNAKCRCSAERLHLQRSLNSLKSLEAQFGIADVLLRGYYTNIETMVWYIYIYIAIIEYICRWDRTSYNDIKVSELWNECSHWADVPTLEATNGWFTSNLTFLSRFPFKDFPYSLTILNPYQRLWASEISASSSVPQIPRGSRSRSRFVCLSLFLIWGSHHCVWEGQSVAASIEFLRLHVCCNCWPECHQLQCSY